MTGPTTPTICAPPPPRPHAPQLGLPPPPSAPPLLTSLAPSLRAEPGCPCSAEPQTLGVHLSTHLPCLISWTPISARQGRCQAFPSLSKPSAPPLLRQGAGRGAWGRGNLNGTEDLKGDSPKGRAGQGYPQGSDAAPPGGGGLETGRGERCRWPPGLPGPPSSLERQRPRAGSPGVGSRAGRLGGGSAPPAPLLLVVPCL